MAEKTVNLTVNLTVKIDEVCVLDFESWMDNNLEVIDFKILPDTNELYENDKVYQRLVKAVKTAQRARDVYINEKNIK